jgi:hypothetical protein
MVQAEPEDDASGSGVEERRLLPQEIGEDHQPVRARRQASGFVVQAREFRASVLGALQHPPHERAARGHAPVEEVAPREVVQIEVEARVKDGAGGGVEDVARSAELDERLPRLDDASGERRGDVVGTACHDGGPATQA